MNDVYWVFNRSQFVEALRDFLETVPAEQRAAADESIRRFIDSPAAETHGLIAHIGGAT